MSSLTRATGSGSICGGRRSPLCLLSSRKNREAAASDALMVPAAGTSGTQGH